MHDSGSRGALGCHPGTREEYIRTITNWGSGEWQSDKLALLMTGPAGAGKSAIAQTCAHNIAAAGNLGASFFFFRPGGWNDPKKFIPTIAYQLATRYPAYHDYINTLVLGDPLVLGKAMDIQFRELLVRPFQKLKSAGKGMVIIIDGLDECATVDAQVQIITLITTSIYEQTSPFLWAFFSRPEPPITSAFSSEIATNVSWSLPLTLSGNADSDIRAYLCGSFRAIRAKYNISTTEWPTEDHSRSLVSQSAGLFVYAVTAIRYIGGLSKGTSGLEERLHAVLQLDPTVTESPFSALDQLYILIMMQIPPGVLLNTRSLFLLLQYRRLLQNPTDNRLFLSVAPSVRSCCLALGLSSTQFHVAISNLYSVLNVEMSENGEAAKFQFYHKSFLDFLLDPRRCKQYFIGSPDVRQHSLEMIVHTLVTAAYTDTGEH
jgi:hypothetical protein